MIYCKAHKLAASMLSCLITTLAAANPPELPAQDLLGYWRFDESAGALAADASGKNNHATLVNGPSWLPGVNGNALSLTTADGQPGRYVQFPASLQGQAFPANGTLAFWIKGSFSSTQAQRKILDQYDMTRDHLFIRASRVLDQGVLQIGLQNKGNYVKPVGAILASGIPAPGMLPVAPDSWTHVALAWDSGKQMMRIYKNGELAISYFWEGEFNGWQPRQQSLQFGVPGKNEGADMALDGLALYQRALSPAELKAMYAGTPVPPPDTSAPPAPAGCSAEPASPNSATLRWSAAQDETALAGYRLYRDGMPVAYLPPSATGFLATGLGPASDYTFAVVAYDSSGNLAAPCVIAARTTDARLLFHSGLEANDPGAGKLDGWTVQSPPGAVSVSQEQARAGVHSLKFDFKFADWREKSMLRAEAAPSPNNSAVTHVLGNSYWSGFSQFIPASWDDEKKDNNEEVVWQYHGAIKGPSSIGAPLALYLDKGRARIVLQANEQPGSVYWPAAADKGKAAHMPPPHELWSESSAQLKGRWVDWVIHVNFDYGATPGFVQVWKDGVKIVDYTGLTMYRLDKDYQDNENGPYLKMGDYKWGWGARPSSIAERVLYVDEVRIGSAEASCADVLPSGAQPCGQPVVSDVAMRSDLNSPGIAHVGSRITLTFVLNQPPFSVPKVMLAGRAATVVAGANSTWSAYIDVTAGDADGPVDISVAAVNNDGSAATTAIRVTVGLPVLVDKQFAKK
ncbi:heparin lyase I family protein [Rugamonas sp. DEMB1]|uniref:heparin lyase I family protein n=1 Tax=Rugamonas sp. DEMB1 TaxID=3039386 RepID=UPI002449F0C1|nr:heparin lyase I family protein [Rugamonas sp. DEMB1]WGG50167.1 heparin lyase I family protein [Rugamonas sp. DEMB1]